MTDFRSRDVGPRERFGVGFERGEYPTDAGYLTSFWSSFGRSMGFAWDDVKARWSGVVDLEAEQLTAAEHMELVGDRPIPYDPFRTRGQLERHIAEHDFDQSVSGWQDRPAADFLGGLLPYAVDPVTVATYPVGGGALQAAARATTTRGFLRNVATASGAISAASLPAEALVQAQTYGELRGDVLGMTALAPLVFTPALGALTRGLSARATVNLDAPAPRITPTAAVPEVPRARLDESFGDYQGGARRWLQDIARGHEPARQHARRLGIDPHAEALQKLIQQQARLTARRTPPPAEERLQALADISTVARRAATEEAEGLVRSQLGDLEVDRMQTGVASREAGQLIDTWEAAALRRLERTEDEMAQLLDLPEFRELGEALRTPAFARTSEQRIAYKAFIDDGVEGLTARHINDLEGRYARAAEEVGRLARDRDDLPKGAERNEVIKALREANARRSQLAKDIEAATARLGRLDEEVPIEDLMRALDAARLESPVPPQPGRTAPKVSPLQQLFDESGGVLDMADLRAQAGSVGVDMVEMERVVKELTESVARCGL